MSEAIQIILGILFLIGVFILTQWGVALRLRRACRFLVKDLERKQAFDAESAVALPYAKRDPFRIGLRDFKPKAMESLLAEGIVGQTAEGTYYLLKRDTLL